VKGGTVRALAICFGQFGPYHHARVAALPRAVRPMTDPPARCYGVTSAREQGSGLGQGGSADHCKLITDDCTHPLRVLPVQIAAATTTYAWKASDNGNAGPRDRRRKTWIGQARNGCGREDRFEFSKHAVDQSILRGISVAEIRRALYEPEILEDYPRTNTARAVFYSASPSRGVHCTSIARIQPGIP
jgi:hypothetical protein